MPPQGVVSFPGVNNPIRASYTLSHGISPGVCNIEASPQALYPSDPETLTLAFDTKSVSFPNCIIDNVRAQKTENGLIHYVKILDRRWRWQFGCVEGSYNRKDDANKLILASEKTPQQLATILLTAMGESNFDVSELPNNDRPFVQWEPNSVPAVELQDLCDSLGCRVVLKLDDTVKLERVGTGKLLLGVLPSVTIDASLSVDPPARPKRINVTGAPTVVQAEFRLEAVGKDVDGTIKPINQLSYIPGIPPGVSDAISFTDSCFRQRFLTGWDLEHHDFPNIQNAAQRKLAEETVWRWYRIVVEPTSPLRINHPRLNVTLTSRDEVLPIADQLHETYIEPFTLKKKHKEATIRGCYHLRNAVLVDENTTETTRVRSDFSINGKTGVVIFPQAMQQFKQVTDPNTGQKHNLLHEATLYLTCTFNVRNIPSGRYTRWSQSKTTGGLPGSFGVKCIHKPKDIVLRLKQFISNSGLPINGQYTDNIVTDQLLQKSNFYADQEIAKLITAQSGTESYAGIHEIEPDGAIEEVTWAIDPDNGTITSASRNKQANPHRPKFDAVRKQVNASKLSASRAAIEAGMARFDRWEEQAKQVNS